MLASDASHQTVNNVPLVDEVVVTSGVDDGIASAACPRF